MADHNQIELSIKSNIPNPVASCNYARNFYVSKVRLLIAMVGLPIRGKSYTASKLVGFLQWLGIRTKAFKIDGEGKSSNRKNNSNNHANDTVTYNKTGLGYSGPGIPFTSPGSDHMPLTSTHAQHSPSPLPPSSSSYSSYSSYSSSSSSSSSSSYSALSSSSLSSSSSWPSAHSIAHSSPTPASHPHAQKVGHLGHSVRDPSPSPLHTSSPYPTNGTHASTHTPPLSSIHSHSTSTHTAPSTGNSIRHPTPIRPVPAPGSSGKFNPNSVGGSSNGLLDDGDYIVETVLSQIFNWLDTEGEIAIFDATNTTKERRTQIIKICNAREPRVPVIFVENICDDPNVLAENFKQKILHSAEYKGLPFNEATTDLKRRIHASESVYKPIEDESLSYIKIINLQSKVICNRIVGSIPQMLTSFLMSLHTMRRPIWFARPADCETIRDESKTPRTVITPSGEKYARTLREFLHSRIPERLRPKLIIYSGTSTQALQTAKYIVGAQHIQTTSLNKMQTGECRGMSTRLLKDKLPEIYQKWDEDRFNYRFPGGESFADLLQRLRQLVIELEQLAVPALIISHQAPIQALYCYFKGKPPQMGPLLAVPSHTVIELVSTHHGWQEKHFKL